MKNWISSKLKLFMFRQCPCILSVKTERAFEFVRSLYTCTGRQDNDDEGELSRPPRSPEQVALDRAAIRRLLDENTPQSQIAKKLDLNISTVHREKKLYMEEQGKPPVEDDKRSPEQRAADFVRISELYVKGWSLTAIAGEMKLGVTTIFREVERLRKMWAEQPIANLNERRNQISEALTAVYAEAWREYDASKKKRTKTKQKIKYEVNEDTGDETPHVLPLETTTEARNGDPRYLKVMIDTQELMAKLFGVNGPEKHEHSGPDGKPIDFRNLQEVSDEALERIIAAGLHGRGKSLQ